MYTDDGHQARFIRPNQQLLTKEPFRSILPAKYPSIVTVDGYVIFVDELGTIDGLTRDGKRRCDHPAPPPKTEDVLAVMQWIEHRGLRPIKSPTVSSYKLKHAAEKFIGRHIGNGSLIIAMDRCGFNQRMERNTWCAMNTYIGVSLKQYRDLPEATGEASA